MLNKTYATIHIEDFFKDISELDLKYVDSGISKSIFISKNNKYNVEIEALKTINFTIQFSVFISCTVKGKDRLLKPTYYFITMDQDFSIEEGFCQINALIKYLFNTNNRSEIKNIKALYFKNNQDSTKDFINGKIKEEPISILYPTKEYLQQDLYSLEFHEHKINTDILVFLSKKEEYYIEIYPDYSAPFEIGTNFIINIQKKESRYKGRKSKPNEYKINTFKKYNCLPSFFKDIISNSNEKMFTIEAKYFDNNIDITEQLIEKNNIINKVKNF